VQSGNLIDPSNYRKVDLFLLLISSQLSVQIQVDDPCAAEALLFSIGPSELLCASNEILKVVLDNLETWVLSLEP
jgi:hypothetical protein